MELHQLPMHEIIKLVENNTLSQKCAAQIFIDRLNSQNASLNAFISTNANAIQQAENSCGKLRGVPIAIKDNIAVENMRLTCGSKMLENYVSPFSATAVHRLLDAGATICGKTNLDEFAMGSSNEFSYFGAVKNPHNHNLVPGGSSGGSAAAVAAGMCAAALGSDTGGSVRQPAAFCGTVGFKPSYGRISRYGLVAFASSLDQIGFLTKDVLDAAMLYEICAGVDEFDCTTIDSTPSPVDLSTNVPIKPKIAVLAQSFSPTVDENIRERLRNFIDRFDAEFEIVDFPELEYAVPVYFIIAPAEASANLARYDGVRYGYRSDGANELLDMYLRTRAEGFGEEVRRRIMTGTFVLSAGFRDEYFTKAQKARRLISQNFAALYEHFDFIVSPTTPTAAFAFGEKLADPVSMYMCDYFTVGANLYGGPAISLPAQRAGELPFGIQICAPHTDDDKLLSFAANVEDFLLI